MTSRRDEGLPDPRNPTIRAIAVQERRKVLNEILTRASLSEEILAECIASDQRGSFPPKTTEIEALQAKLTHVHLPALEAASLIAWDRDEGTVEATTHPALTDPRFTWLLGIESDRLDAVLLGLSHEYRRIVLTVLRDGQRPMSRATLAREILRRREITDPDSKAAKEVSISLYHTHLPKLSASDFIEYDAEKGRAMYTAHSVLEDVFEVIYDPDEHLVDKYDGFLGGLRDSYPQVDQDRSTRSGWPRFWREPYRG